MSSDLLPCPFCGGTDVGTIEWYTEDGDYEGAECNDCKAGAPLSVWNNRQTGGWIAVEDALPMPMFRHDLEMIGKRYLQPVYLGSEIVLATDGIMVRDALLNVATGGGVYALNFDNQITHWMPLPKLPHGDTSQGHGGIG